MSFRRLLFVALMATSLSATAAVVKVVDTNGQALAGVNVLIGTAAGQPFSGNQLTTDANGQFTTPAGWTEAMPVTIEGNDLVRTTFMATLPNVGQLKISRADGNQKIEIQGTLTDYGQIRTDGKLDAGAFIPALPRNQLLYFDVGWLVSPEFDTLRIMGREIAIPSNLAVPEQRESYIVPITFNKPNFRMFVRRPGQYRFMAIHGQFPLKRVVDDYRSGAPAYDIMNHGTLLQSGYVDLNVAGPIRNLSVPVNQATFTNDVIVQAPPMAADDVVLSVAMSEIDGGALLPSDVKRLRNGQPQTLKAPANKGTPLALSAWMKERNTNRSRMQPLGALTAEDLMNLPFDLFYDVFQDKFEIQAATVDYKQLSFATHTRPGQAPQFVSLISPPQVSGSRLNLSVPTAPTNVKPLATLVMYSSIKLNRRGEIQTEERTRLWEVWTSGWVSSLDLPNLPALQKSQADKFRWEVLYLGQDGQDITHVSRNAVDL